MGVNNESQIPKIKGQGTGDIWKTAGTRWSEAAAV